MSQPQQNVSLKLILAPVQSGIGTVVGLVKTVVGLLLAVALLATLMAMVGYPIPYVPAVRGSLQEIGIFSAALAYWLKS